MISDVFCITFAEKIFVKNFKFLSNKVKQNTSANIYIVEPSFEGSEKNYFGDNYGN